MMSEGAAAVQVTNLFSGYVSALLAEHASNPSQNWKAKDCAMYLVVALAVRGRTAAAGVTSTNQLVNIQDFFSQQVSHLIHLSMCLTCTCDDLQIMCWTCDSSLLQDCMLLAMAFHVYAVAAMGRWALFTCKPSVYSLPSCAAQFSTSHVRHHALKL